MEQRRTRRMGVALLLGLAPLAVLSACGDDDDTIEDQSQEYCESVDELATDLRALGDLDASNSKEDIEDLRDEIEDDIDDVRESGEDLAQEQKDELNDAFTAFQQAVDSISDDQSISASLQVLAVDIAQLTGMVREIAAAGNCENGTTTTAG
jgi:hypothetical protein